MPRREWRLIQAWKAKRQGQVWVVENQYGRRGYFKFARADQWFFSGPMIANEYISAALAQKLGFPTADLEQAKVEGPDGVEQQGIVSLALPALEVITWREANAAVHKHPEKHVHNLERLAQLVVFDAWIANIDRATGKNLVLHRDKPDEKYNWYLIDHGHCLYGSPRKWKRGQWDTKIWEQLWRYYNVPKGLLRLQSHYDILLPMIRKIEALNESDIEMAMQTVPKSHLKEKERRFIKRLLLHRQKQLRKIIQRWLDYKGIKEYGEVSRG
ncbi:MAG TPA: HipA family kinase [Bacilli bacterium]|nr:HipA family kinase [Bacilli bacterium]